MSGLEAYLFLFFDSLKAELILLPNTHMAFNVMSLVSNYNLRAVVAVSMVADLVGATCNYAFGHVLNYVKNNFSSKSPSEKFIALENMVQRKLFLLAIFSSVPLIGVLITTLSGFFRVPYSRFFIALLIGRIIYYILALYL